MTLVEGVLLLSREAVGVFYRPSWLGKQSQTPYILKHFLIECIDITLIGQRCFSSNNMEDLYENVDIGAILSFFKEIKLYQKLQT